eukprot:Rmarinus@m.8644
MEMEIARFCENAWQVYDRPSRLGYNESDLATLIPRRNDYLCSIATEQRILYIHDEYARKWCRHVIELRQWRKDNAARIAEITFRRKMDEARQLLSTGQYYYEDPVDRRRMGAFRSRAILRTVSNTSLAASTQPPPVQPTPRETPSSQPGDNSTGLEENVLPLQRSTGSHLSTEVVAHQCQQGSAEGRGSASVQADMRPSPERLVKSFGGRGKVAWMGGEDDALAPLSASGGGKRPRRVTIGGVVDVGAAGNVGSGL